jgi:hypothetical protein
VRSVMAEAAGIAGEAENNSSSKALWLLLWGALGLLSVVSTAIVLTGSARWIAISGRYGLLLGGMLAAGGAVQLARGVLFLSHKERALAGFVLVLFGSSQLDRGLMLGRVAPARYDFSAFYVAGRLAAESSPRRLYYQAVYPDGRISTVGAADGWTEVTRHYGVSEALTFVYPPLFAVLLKPIAHFSYSAAFGLWSFLTVVLTLASVWICTDLGGRRINLELGLILGVGLFSYAPFLQELVLGQTASLILFLGALGTWLLSRGRDWSSAFCFAVATMIKITPALAVPLLIMHRKWKWLGAYACWMAVLAGFSVWQMGWAAHEEFLHGVMPSVSCGITWFPNLSLGNYVQELFLGYAPTTLAQPTLPPLACTVSKVAALAVFCGMMVRLYFCRRKENLVLHLALLQLLSLAISPITWGHHYVIALLPFVYLWCRLGESSRDYLLLAMVLVVGTTLFAFVLPVIFSHATLVLGVIVPCLTVAFVYVESSGRAFAAANRDAA